MQIFYLKIKYYFRALIFANTLSGRYLYFHNFFHNLFFDLHVNLSRCARIVKVYCQAVDK